MELISAKCTDVITRTMYHKTTHEYHYDYTYNNEEYNLEFYKALYLYNQNDVKHFDYFGTKIKQQYKNTVEKAISLKKQLKNAYYKFSTAKKVRFPLQKRKPLFDQNFTFKNIQAIISYYATMGEISEKDEILLNNELEFYNNNIIPTQNQEKEYKTKEYNEVPNILDSGFEMFDLIEVNSNRLETINSYVNDLKSYISQLNIDEIIIHNVKDTKDIIEYIKSLNISLDIFADNVELMYDKQMKEKNYTAAID